MVFSLLPAACAPVQPGDPAYQWVVGKWVGETGYGNPADAAFQVQNGNQVTGGFTYHSASGRVSYGTIQSGVVGRKNDVDFIEGQNRWRKHRQQGDEKYERCETRYLHNWNL